MARAQGVAGAKVGGELERYWGQKMKDSVGQAFTLRQEVTRGLQAEEGYDQML